MLVGSIGVGAGLGTVTAWLWLRGTGNVFSVFLGLIAVAAGIAGGWYGFLYGTGVEPECCASPDMGPMAYAVLGAVLCSNVVTLLVAIPGQAAIRAFRRRHRLPASPSPQIR